MPKNKTNNLPANHSGKQDAYKDLHIENDRIEIWLDTSDKKIEQEDVVRLCFDYFRRDSSLTTPIFITYSHPKYNHPDCAEFQQPIPIHLVVNENNTDIDDSEFDEYIADIAMSEYPGFLLVFINVRHVDSENWAKLMKVIKAIISKMRELKFNIKSVSPADLQFEILESELTETQHMQENPLQPWEQIEERASDRTILKLWHEQHTVKEIAQKIDLNPRTVRNILTDLRKKYGEDIAPYAEQQKRKFLSKTS